MTGPGETQELNTLSTKANTIDSPRPGITSRLRSVDSLPSLSAQRFASPQTTPRPFAAAISPPALACLRQLIITNNTRYKRSSSIWCMLYIRHRTSFPFPVQPCLRHSSLSSDWRWVCFPCFSRSTLHFLCTFARLRHSKKLFKILPRDWSYMHLATSAFQCFLTSLLSHYAHSGISLVFFFCSMCRLAWRGCAIWLK
jgi:hypothetical protein